MAATFQSIPVSHHGLEAQISAMLRYDEQFLARVDAHGNLPKWIEMLPIVRNAFGLLRTRRELVVTNERLIMIRVGRWSRSVKNCRAAALEDLRGVMLNAGESHCSLRISIKGGVVLNFCRIEPEAATAFYNRFPFAGLPLSVRTTVRDGAAPVCCNGKPANATAA